MKKDKIQSENTKKLPRFGALDVLIILVVIVLIVGIFFRYKLLDIITAQQNLNEYNVAFSVDNVRYTTPDYISVGDTVYLNGEKFGIISSGAENAGALSVAPASEMFTDSNGNIIEVHYPNETRVSFSGNMLCNAMVSETGAILVNGDVYIAPGQTLEVTTELVSITIEINSIELKQ